MLEARKTLENFAKLSPEEQARALASLGIPKQQKRPQVAPKVTPLDSLKSQPSRKRRPAIEWT